MFENLKWHHNGMPPRDGVYYIKTYEGEIIRAWFDAEDHSYSVNTETIYSYLDIDYWAYEQEPEPTPPVHAAIVWHDVMESLPEPGKTVLVSYYSLPNLFEVEPARFVKFEHSYSFEELDREYGMEIDNVTHWAYLPDPVNPKESENA